MQGVFLVCDVVAKMEQLAQIIITIPGKQYAFYWLSLFKYGDGYECMWP